MHHNHGQDSVVAQVAQTAACKDFGSTCGDSQVDKLARVKFALHFNAVAIEIVREIKRAAADEEREFQLEYDLLDLCLSFLDLKLE